MKRIAWICSVIALCSGVFAYAIIRSGSPSVGFEGAIWVGALLFWSGTLAVVATGLLCVVSLEAHATPAGPAPWHLWLVGLLMLTWNAMSCVSHVMTLTQNAAYFRSTGVTPQIAAYFAALPAWYVVAWTIGVWGGVVAAVGLLMRKSWTVWWFAASQLAMAVNSVATLLNPEAHEVLGKVGSIGAIVVITLGALVVLYSMAMKRHGVLR
jgi:hypothetical protein